MTEVVKEKKSRTRQHVRFVVQGLYESTESKVSLWFDVDQPTHKDGAAAVKWLKEHAKEGRTYRHIRVVGGEVKAAIETVKRVTLT